MADTRTPVSDADLRWQYRLTGWAERGISLDEALASPELRAGIERSHPDHITR